MPLSLNRTLPFVVALACLLTVYFANASGQTWQQQQQQLQQQQQRAYEDQQARNRQWQAQQQQQQALDQQNRDTKRILENSRRETERMNENLRRNMDESRRQQDQSRQNLQRQQDDMMRQQQEWTRQYQSQQQAWSQRLNQARNQSTESNSPWNQSRSKRSSQVTSAFDRQLDADRDRWETAAHAVTSRIDRAHEQRRKSDRVQIMLEQRRSARNLDVSKRIREATKSAGQVSGRVRQRIDQRQNEDIKRLNKAKAAKKPVGSSLQHAKAQKRNVPIQDDGAPLPALSARFSKSPWRVNDGNRGFLVQALSRREEWEEA
ncbi:MAG: hypothetical protein ACJ8FY_08445 [Gemmataceae bacterium]